MHIYKKVLLKYASRLQDLKYYNITFSHCYRDIHTVSVFAKLNFIYNILPMLSNDYLSQNIIVVFNVAKEETK